jgi:ADP-ribose pyrophosphatase YjhB (NUDIX family)
MSEPIPDLLRWARQIFSLSQAGMAYSHNEYDLERYHQLQEMAAEMLASRTELSLESIRDSFTLQAGYPTPKIDVRGAVIRDGKVLLIQEKADGRWAMPGGWADIGDLPAETVQREVWEESGFRVRVEKVIAVYDNNHVALLEFYHAYKLIFQCRITDGQPATSIETLAVDFFPLDDLPPLSEGRTSRLMLEEVFAHQRDPARPTAFD